MKHAARTLAVAASLARWVRKERPATAVRISFGFLVLGILAAGFFMAFFATIFRERVTAIAALWVVACLVFGPLACWFSGIGNGVVWLFKRHRTALVVSLFLIGLIFSLVIISVRAPAEGASFLAFLVLLWLGPMCWLSGVIAAIIGFVRRSGSRIVCILGFALNSIACVADIAVLGEIGKGFGRAMGT